MGDIEDFVPRQRLQQEQERQRAEQEQWAQQQGLGAMGGMLGGGAASAGAAGISEMGGMGGAGGAEPSPEDKEAMMEQMGAYLEVMEKENPEQFKVIMAQLMAGAAAGAGAGGGGEGGEGGEGEDGVGGLSDSALQDLMRQAAAAGGEGGDPGSNAGPLNMPGAKGGKGMRMGAAGLEEEHKGANVTPLAGFVMKTKRDSDGRKVFINVCHSPDLQAPSLKKKLDAEGNEQEGTNIPLALGPVAEDVDKAGVLSLVYDCIVNTKVIEDAEADATGQFRNFICELCLNYVEQKFKQPLDHRYKLPKLKYKGETLRVQRVRAQVAPTIQDVSGGEGDDPMAAIRDGATAGGAGGRGVGAKPPKPARRAPVTRQYVKTQLLCNDGDGAPDRPLDDGTKPAVEGGAVHLPASEAGGGGGGGSGGGSVPERTAAWPAQLVFRADFSGAEHPLTAAEVSVTVTPELLCVGAPGFHVCEVFLPFPVRDAGAVATFDAERGALAVVVSTDPSVAFLGASQPDPGSSQWVLASALSEGAADRESSSRQGEGAGGKKPPTAAEQFHLQVPTDAATLNEETSKNHFEDEEFPEDRFHSQDVMSQQILQQRKKEKADKTRKSDDERRERHRKAGRTDEDYDNTFVMEETSINPSTGEEETTFVDMRPKGPEVPSLTVPVTEQEISASVAAKAVADLWAKDHGSKAGDTTGSVALASSGLAFELLD